MNWPGGIGWGIGILLLVGATGVCWMIYARGRKKPHTAPVSPAPAEPAGPSMEELRVQRAELERKKQEVLGQYKQRQQAERFAREQWNYLNDIENTFYREFGLVERMAEIQKCLSMEAYTGSADENVIDTQLANMARAIRQLEERREKPILSNPQELFIPGWFAMEETEKRLEQTLPSGQSALKKLYRVQLEDVGRALEKQTAQWNEASVPQLPEADKVRYWECRLTEVKQLIGDPNDMDKRQRTEAARHLAEYAAEHFKDRL